IDKRMLVSSPAFPSLLSIIDLADTVLPPSYTVNTLGVNWRVGSRPQTTNFGESRFYHMKPKRRIKSDKEYVTNPNSLFSCFLFSSFLSSVNYANSIFMDLELKRLQRI